MSKELVAIWKFVNGNCGEISCFDTRTLEVQNETLLFWNYAGVTSPVYESKEFMTAIFEGKRFIVSEDRGVAIPGVHFHIYLPQDYFNTYLAQDHINFLLKSFEIEMESLKAEIAWKESRIEEIKQTLKK